MARAVLYWSHQFVTFDKQSSWHCRICIFVLCVQSFCTCIFVCKCSLGSGGGRLVPASSVRDIESTEFVVLSYLYLCCVCVGHFVSVSLCVSVLW